MEKSTSEYLKVYFKKSGYKLKGDTILKDGKSLGKLIRAFHTDKDFVVTIARDSSGRRSFNMITPRIEMDKMLRGK